MIDIQYFYPESLDEDDEGGGLITTNLYPGAVSNALFPPPSDLDYLGRVRAKKLFGSPVSDDASTLYGACWYLTAPPQNPAVSVVMMEPTAFGDHRAEIAELAAAWFLRTGEAPFVLFGGQAVINSRTLFAYQLETDPEPAPGEVYCLVQDKPGYPYAEQYVRLTSVSSTLRTFVDSDGSSFVRRVLTLRLSEGLRYLFTTLDVPVKSTRHTSPTRIMATYVSDAARYYSVAPLAQAAQAGTLEVTVDSIYARLAPSSEQYVSIVDHQAGAQSTMLLPGAAAPVVLIPSFTGSTIPVGVPLYPGSITVTGAGKTLTDDKTGVLAGGGVQAEVDYLQGQISDLPSTGPWTVAAIPAADLLGAGFTAADPVTIANRDPNWTRTLLPAPLLGTVTASARIQGKWYTLRSDATGVFRGDAGSGVVIGATGTASVTWKGAPDVDSAVLWSWQSAAVSETHAGTFSPGRVGAHISVPPPVQAQTLAASWAADGENRTAGATAAGVLTGDASGALGADGGLWWSPALLPDLGIALHLEVQQVLTPHTESFTPTIANGAVSLTLATAPVGHTLEITVPRGAGVAPLILVDDGSGGLVVRNRVADLDGSVDGATVEFEVEKTVTTAFWVYDRYVRYLQSSTHTVQYWKPEYGPIVVRYAAAGDSWQAHISDHVIGALEIDFSDVTEDRPTYPGGVEFTLSGWRYRDRDGVLLHVIDGAGNTEVAGTYDYATSKAVLTLWAAGAAVIGSYRIVAAGVQWYTASVVGRIGAGELRPGKTQVRFKTAGGEIVNAVADNQGVIVADGLLGSIDISTGIYDLQFGALVLDSSLSPQEKADDWYDPDDVDQDGYIWKPEGVPPSEILLNTVAVIRVPLDKDVVGFDTVRLAEDGKVPWVWPGATVMVSNTQTTDIGTVVAGQVIQLPRSNLAEVILLDDAGAVVPANHYQYNLALGQATIASPFDSTGIQQPLKARHTIETLATALDVQVGGQISLSIPLGHDYPAGTSYVSSALVLGDRSARVRRLRFQKTWTGVWSDELIGDPTEAALYDQVNFPIEVVNRTAIDMDVAVIYLSANVVKVLERTLGYLGEFNITAGNVAPINPKTGQVLLRLQQAGLRPGSYDNVIRFRVIPASSAVWFFLCINLSQPYTGDDSFAWKLRGNQLPGA